MIFIFSCPSVPIFSILKLIFCSKITVLLYDLSEDIVLLMNLEILIPVLNILNKQKNTTILKSCKCQTPDL